MLQVPVHLPERVPKPLLQPETQRPRVDHPDRRRAGADRLTGVGLKHPDRARGACGRDRRLLQDADRRKAQTRRQAPPEGCREPDEAARELHGVPGGRAGA